MGRSSMVSRNKSPQASLMKVDFDEEMQHHEALRHIELEEIERIE